MDTYKIERLFHLLMERLDRHEKMLDDLLFAASGSRRIRRKARSADCTTANASTTTRTSV
jgi:hypothetical protein